MENKKTAIYLIDDTLPRSSWDYDLRGGNLAFSDSYFWTKRPVKSVGNGYPCTLKRDFNEQTDGILTFVTNYNIISGDGFYFEFSDRKNEALRLTQKDGFLWADDEKLFELSYGEHHIQIDIDIDNTKAYIISDAKYKAECNFTGIAADLSSFKFGYDGDTVGEAYVALIIKLFKNYIFNDTCLADFPGDMPVGYDVKCSGNAKAERVLYGGVRKFCVYDLMSDNESSCTVERRFEKIEDKLCFDIKYLPSQNDGDAFSINLLNGDKIALKLYDKDLSLCCDGSVLKKHSANVWQALCVEADVKKKTALVWLNGKKIKEVNLEQNTDLVDGFSVKLEAKNESHAMFSDVRISRIFDTPADYVPKPVVPKKTSDHKVGMLMCSLWREGQHYGWDCITPFEKDHKPLLGWYDEGNPETADWEVKWMCEHGVDYQMFCWFSTETDRPMKDTDMSAAIHDGYMKAKYSDKVKMSIIWEAQAKKPPKSREDFRKYFVPYFIDYFFSDERYMTVDGKAVMSIFGVNKIIDAFGGADNVREEFDYLRIEVKKLGYEDLLIFCCGPSNQPIYKQCGFDGNHQYNWMPQGNSAERIKEAIEREEARGNLHITPTVSVGQNLVAWTGYKHANTSVEDIKELLRWCKEDYLTRFDKDSWLSKMIVLATWNEYGEGTYICPSKLNGFDYLDAVRSAFTEDLPHTDVVPSENQLSRINVLYDKGRATVAPLDDNPIDNEYHGVYKKYEFKTQDDLDKWEFNGFSSIEIKDGKLVGHSDKADPHMILKEMDFLPFSASKVQKIRVHLKAAKEGGQMCCCQASFTNSPEGVLPSRMTFNLTNPNEIAEIDIQVRRNRGWPWKEKITAFRFDPIYAVGDFELVDIEFMKSSTKWDFCLDGHPITLAGDIYEEDSEYYVPFDTTSKLKYTEGIFWEWKAAQEQFIIKSALEATFTNNSDIAVVNGEEIKMKKPLCFYDGVPCIPASLFAKIIGRKMNVSDDRIDFSKE